VCTRTQFERVQHGQARQGELEKEQEAGGEEVVQGQGQSQAVQEEEEGACPASPALHTRVLSWAVPVRPRSAALPCSHWDVASVRAMLHRRSCCGHNSTWRVVCGAASPRPGAGRKLIVVVVVVVVVVVFGRVVVRV
jgi:hypothetical protein